LQLTEIVRGKDFGDNFDKYSNRYLKRLR